MKRQKKLPGSILTWTLHWGNHDGDRARIRVGIKGVDGFQDFAWDRTEPKGGHYAAAKKVAQARGFDDVEEIGVLEMGSGFIFYPVLKEREK